MPDFVQTAPVDTTTRGLIRGMAAKTATKHDFTWMLLVRLPRWLILHPLATAGLVASAWLWTRGFPLLVALALALLPHAAWTERHGFFGVLAAAVRRRDYRRILPTLSNYWRIRRGWATGTTAIGFRQPGKGGALPRLRHWEVTATGLAAWATPGRFGWTADDVTRGARVIAAGVKGCRTVVVTEGNTPGVARIDFAFSDPLADIVPITALPVPPRGKLSCGITERGEPAHLFTHLSTLVVGLPGSGKSNLLWTLIASAMASKQPFELWVLDPAGGVELYEFSNGSPLVRKYASTRVQMQVLVKQMHEAMHDRLAAMAGKNRLHEPTEAEPRMWLVVDEMISVVHSLGPEHTNLLVEILSIGRKAAVTVTALTQIPFGHTLGEKVRTLFPQKVLFRVNDTMVTSSIFGGGAEILGASASKIKISTPGVGYLIMDTDPRPTRFRSPYITDSFASMIARGFLPDGVPAVEGGGISWHNHEHVLYRWSDPDGRVLYVGISIDGLRRADEHLSSEQKAAFRARGVRMEVEQVFNTESCAAELERGLTVKQVAEAAEAALIRELEPPLNVAHNPGRRRRAKAAVGS